MQFDLDVSTINAVFLKLGASEYRHLEEPSSFPEPRLTVADFELSLKLALGEYQYATLKESLIDWTPRDYREHIAKQDASNLVD